MQKFMNQSDFEHCSIKTERLTIKPLSETRDGDAVYEWCKDRAFQIYWHLPNFTSKDSFLSWLKRRKERKWDFVGFIGDEAICLISYSGINGKEIFSYCCSPAHRGHGYTKEALKAIIDYLGVTSAYLHIDVTNTPSIRLAEKLGFTPYAHISPRATEYVWRRTA